MKTNNIRAIKNVHCPHSGRLIARAGDILTPTLKKGQYNLVPGLKCKVYTIIGNHTNLMGFFEPVVAPSVIKFGPNVTSRKFELRLRRSAYSRSVGGELFSSTEGSPLGHIMSVNLRNVDETITMFQSIKQILEEANA